MNSPTKYDKVRIDVLNCGLPTDIEVSSVDYSDSALRYPHDYTDADEALLQHHALVLKQWDSKGPGLPGGKAAYSAYAILSVDSVVNFLRHTEVWPDPHLDIVVRYSMSGVDHQVKDTLLNCRPIFVGTQIICRVEHILWDGRPALGQCDGNVLQERCQKLLAVLNANCACRRDDFVWTGKSKCPTCRQSREIPFLDGVLEPE